jgi:serine protease Do
MDNIPSEGIISEKSQSQTEKKGKYLRITTIAFVLIIVLTIVLASLFGAIFGFVSGGAASIFSSKITQKIQQYFPKITLPHADSNADKQQIIVEDSAVIDVVRKSSPAVVSIIISKDVPNTPQDFFNNPGSFFDPFFGGNSPQQTPQPQGGQGGTTQQQIGGGSGFFITSDGLLLTNRHVVEDTQASYTVVTSDGKQYAATVLARDPVRDVAVIKIDGNNFPTLPLGDSDSLQIGQTIIAIGNSLGEFTNSVSRGIVSGLRRNVDAGSGFGSTERLTDIIQTDAAINPGNSGGPLIDIEGNVIGINVAMAQGAQSIGFALPVNQAKRIIDQAKGGAKISIPFLGVRYIVIDPVVQKEAQLPFDYGVLVLRGSKITDLAVIPGSPADKAGIVENDIILEVNGQKIDSDNQLSDIVMKYNVGDVVTLKIWHKGETKDVPVTLQESNQ